jgi:hypothetical protein
MNENQNVQDFLNENIGNIERFEVWNTYMEVFMKDGAKVEIGATSDCDLDCNILEII